MSDNFKLFCILVVNRDCLLENTKRVLEIGTLSH